MNIYRKYSLLLRSKLSLTMEGQIVRVTYNQKQKYYQYF